MAVAGIDLGSKVAWVAWLEDKRFLLDAYKPSHKNWLPQPPENLGISFYAVDAPQGLPKAGTTERKRRICDVDADTPTRVLPRTRQELSIFRLYGGLIRTGIEVFWAVYSHNLAHVHGLPKTDSASKPTICETYPRFTLKKMFGIHWRIPSKQQDPFDYMSAIWTELTGLGYRCEGVRCPTTDQIDAMLCAIAAQSLAFDLFINVGEAPYIDQIEHVLREGYIVSPA